MCPFLVPFTDLVPVQVPASLAPRAFRTFVRVKVSFNHSNVNIQKLN